MYKKGSISIFLAMTFLTLIVFIMSIYEFTRFQIQELEATQVLMSVGDSVLAAYDSALKNEYGIFARDMDYQDIDFIYKGFATDDLLSAWAQGGSTEIVASAEDEGVKDLKNGASRDLNYYLTENLKASEIKNIAINASMTKSLRSDFANKYIKKEILDFTKMNLPASSLRGLFDSLDVVVKLGKTTEFNTRKNKIVKKAGKMESDFSLLYYYLDGYRVGGKQGYVQINNYVNRIYSPLSGIEGGIPDLSMPQEMRAFPRINIVEVYDDFLLGFKNTIQSSYGMKELYNEFKPVNDEYLELSERLEEIEYEIESIESEIESLEEAQDELTAESKQNNYYEIRIDKLNDELDELEGERVEVEDRKEEIEPEYERLKGEVEDRLDLLESGAENIDKTYEILGDVSLTEGGISSENSSVSLFANPNNSYLENNKKVVKLCLEIAKNGEGIGGDIGKFLKEEDDRKSDYIYGSFESARDSLNRISREYGFAMKETYDRKNNLKLMRELAENNVAIIEGVKDYNDFIYFGFT